MKFMKIHISMVVLTMIHDLFMKKFNGVSNEEACKQELNCTDEAKTFYNIYAKAIGFSVQKDDLKRDKNGGIISPKWVCSKEGHRLAKCFQNENRQCEPRSLARVGVKLHFVLVWTLYFSSMYGETHLLFFHLFGKNLIFRKRLEVATYFCFIFLKGKQNNKEKP